MTKRASFLAIPVLLATLATAGCNTHSGTSAQNVQIQQDTYQSAERTRSRPSLLVETSRNADGSLVLYRPGTRDDYAPSRTVIRRETPRDTAPARGMSPDPDSFTESFPTGSRTGENWRTFSAGATDRSLPAPSPRIDTLVGRKVKELHQQIREIDDTTNRHDMRLTQLQMEGDRISGNYHALTGRLSSHLQSGTTPGNPEMLELWNQAGDELDKLSTRTKDLPRLANDIGNAASQAAFLLDSVRSTFGLSGAVEDDHKNLTALEDYVTQDTVRLNRILNVVNDEINRRNAYLRSERLNMQTLSVAIANGELYGQSMSSRLFSRVADTPRGSDPSGDFGYQPEVPSRRPLVIIRFDRPNVQYQQPLYTALSQAMDRYPGAQFDIVSVAPETRNPAEQALASSNARRNGEDVLRTMTQMGVPTNRVNMGSDVRPGISSGEVHLYIR
ncbi:MAG: hypothetical protein EA357_04510 [Micavibrio sp.]|nr:MAG: hypothetical protein EA357_04510 [Micavibrio sp.]